MAGNNFFKGVDLARFTSNVVYKTFPKIVANDAVVAGLPDYSWSVDDVYRFITSLKDSVKVSKQEVDYYYSQLQGEEKEKFIELFGVVETNSQSPRPDM